MPCIRIKLPDNRGEVTHVLAGERITIGRRPDNTIQIIDRSVSGHHAELVSTNGHYRLHDLGSTNLTFIEGEPVSDFHLHDRCTVSFGTVECEFSPATPNGTLDNIEIVPTRAELEFLRRENQELESKVAAMQTRVDILSSARLVTRESTARDVAPEVYRRITGECNELQNRNANLALEIQGLKDDLVAMSRERDAMRVAWETLKNEQTAQPAVESSDAPVVPPPAAPPMKSKALPATDAAEKIEASKASEDHRAMAAILSKAPGLLKRVRDTLDSLADATKPVAACETVARDVRELNTCLSPIAGHPVQRIVASIDALVQNHATGTSFEAGMIRTIRHAIDLAAQLLDPRNLKRARNLSQPRALVIDDDRELLSTVTAALDSAEIQSAGTANADDALKRLGTESYDLVVLDIGMPEVNGIDVCGRIRELPEHHETPVVFLTVGDTIDNRAQSSLNGGTDFIVKPFNVRELAVKATTWAYRNQLGVPI